MLSLLHGSPIALLSDDTIIKIKNTDDDDSDNDEAEIDTTPENKERILKRFSEKKLKNMTFEKYLSNVLKKNLFFPKSCQITILPIIKQPSFRLSISGLSGSGKSSFTSEFINHNKKFNTKVKGSAVFLFSPVHDDKSLKSINDIIHVDLNDFEAETEREFSLTDVPKGSICIFDDIDSFSGKKLQKKYQELRDVFLQRGRHNDVSVITISHSPMQGYISKSTNMECEYFVIFPSTNKRDSAALLKTYCFYDHEQIQDVLDTKSRWVFIKKSVPAYWISQREIKLF